MIRILTGAALALALAVAPAMAISKSESKMKNQESNNASDILKQEGQNREPGPDGTFQGKPVVQGPADWSKSGSADSSSSGASSGESGSSNSRR
jgi:hypothetical protein